MDKNLKYPRIRNCLYFDSTQHDNILTIKCQANSFGVFKDKANSNSLEFIKKSAFQVMVNGIKSFGYKFAVGNRLVVVYKPEKNTVGAIQKKVGNLLI